MEVPGPESGGRGFVLPKQKRPRVGHPGGVSWGEEEENSRTITTHSTWARRTSGKWALPCDSHHNEAHQLLPLVKLSYYPLPRHMAGINVYKVRLGTLEVRAHRQMETTMTASPRQLPVLSVALPPNIVDRIRREAEADDRKVSQLLRKIIVGYYRAQDARHEAA